MKTAQIKLGAVLDIITNSSTETFVIADKTTIDAVKRLVNSLAKCLGGEKRFDDLFEADLVYEGYSNESLKLIRTKDPSEIGYDPDGYDDFCDVLLEITPKDKSCETAALLLSSLEKLFDYESRYDG